MRNITHNYTKGVNAIYLFQAEEFKIYEIKILKDGIEYFPVRYIHAEYDLN
jgi:hypothetical protein